MKNEISKDFYCSARTINGKSCCNVLPNGCGDCPNYHRKFPTPEQFKEEYGEEWTGAVYFNAFLNGKSCYKDGLYRTFMIDEAWIMASKLSNYEVIILCACTPFGKPDKDWRPE